MKKFPPLILLILIPLACGKLHGEFGFKYSEDKGYKRNLQRYEFDAAKDVQWIYRFDAVQGRSSLGVIILKKELGWIDIITGQDYIDEYKQIVYGTISGLEPGYYRLVLVELVPDSKNRQIDEREFYIYSDEEPLEEPSGY